MPNIHTYKKELKNLLEKNYLKFNNIDFIKDDPISIPHKFDKKRDVEISALITSVIAWGRRSMIISNAKRLFEMMDNAPYDFILNHEESDLKEIENFKHRTFQPTDILYFIHFLKWYYERHDSLEDAFIIDNSGKSFQIKDSLINFNNMFVSLENFPKRTGKHIPNPIRKSTCKRLNMFLRWMVRKDENGVDFGLWNQIPASALMMPIDVHVERISRKLELLGEKTTGWNAVEELTSNLRIYDKEDPVKYDFALFGIGVSGSTMNL